MFGKDVLEYKEALADSEIAEELQRPGLWIIAYVESSMAWPTRAQKVTYRGTHFWIIPITKDACPAVAVRAYGASNEELRERISRFVSVLSWVASSGVLIESFGGGSHLFAYLKPSQRGGGFVCDRLDLRYLPAISDPKAMLALALMREGRGLRHPAYSFLSFWRVLEVAIGRKDIKTWIADAVIRISDHGAKDALEKMKASGVIDLADHLYVSGRCAIAHASNNPIVDPDKPEDARRLVQERPLIASLATLAIEERLGVKTSITIFDEHLYELAGFKTAFGQELVQKIVARDELAQDTRINVPIIDFGLLGRRRLEAFKSLIPASVEVGDGIVQLGFKRTDGRLFVSFKLNFNEERLHFDIHDGFYGPQDDGSVEYANIHADIQEFAKWYYLNGCLEIIDNETGEQISRKDEFIPLNVFVKPEGFDLEIERWRTEAQHRRERRSVIEGPRV